MPGFLISFPNRQFYLLGVLHNETSDNRTNRGHRPNFSAKYANFRANRANVRDGNTRGIHGEYPGNTANCTGVCVIPFCDSRDSRDSRDSAPPSEARLFSSTSGRGPVYRLLRSRPDRYSEIHVCARHAYIPNLPTKTCAPGLLL